jgi:hypothetical protein
VNRWGGRRFTDSTVEDAVALVTRLTGKPPTPEDIAEARREHEAFLAEISKARSGPGTTTTKEDPATSSDPPRKWQQS